MDNYKVISTEALIDKFQEALDMVGGYIWGTAGELWTAAKQAEIEKTTDSNRESARKYGKKWIGHKVWDCSGLFSWAFKQLGSYMYHGSNTMWNQYCVHKGTLKSGKRTDGQGLKPGTAVFTYDKKKDKRGHVGLYIGNGIVIEAAGTIKGVTTSKAKDSKWVEWGELKYVDYGSSPEPQPVPEGKAIVTGTRVALREGPSTSTRVMTRIETGTIVNIAHIEGWTYVTYRGKYGFMMNSFINIHDKSVTVTGKNVAVRAGTGTDTRVLIRIPTGQNVDRAELPKDWEYIEYGDRKGFMMKEFIREG